MNLKARLLGGWIGEKILTATKVEAIVELGARFRRIRLAGIGAKPGDKTQVFIAEVGTRTYSPFVQPQQQGSFDIVAYLHGNGPGTRWARELTVGQTVRLTAPGGSTPFDGVAETREPVALFGDETSLGVACALRGVRPDAIVRLAVGSAADVQPAVDQLGLGPGVLVGNDPVALARELVAATDGRGTLVLTGSGPAIQRLRGELKRAGATRHKQIVKAYWAPGKVGMD